MRVVVYPADQGGCGYYRLIWPSRILAENGHDVHVGLPDEKEGHTGLPDELRVKAMYADVDGKPWFIGLVDEVIPFDLAVFQRPLTRTRADLIRQLRLRGVRIVIELDDDFTNIDPRNVAWRASHPNLSPDANYRVLVEVLRDVDLVTVSTPALAKVYGRYTRRPPVVIPNYVPREYTHIDTTVVDHDGLPEGRRFLGWSGSILTHPGDLEVVGGAVAVALREHENWQLIVVGTGHGVARRFGTKSDGTVYVTGWVPLDRYPLRMANVDLGTVPLRLTAFNQGKSWLKGLEFASLGVPFIASATQQYVELADTHGVGILADNPRAWTRMLRHLMTNDAEREDLGGRWREKVRARLVLEDNVERWWEAWMTAMS